MSNKVDEERDALEDLWAAIFGGPPAVRCNPEMLVEVMIRHLPPAGPYKPQARKTADDDDVKD